jgi:hypothetical protein
MTRCRSVAELEDRTVREVATTALREYLDSARRARLDEVLDQELPHYSEVLRRLG